MKLMVSVTRHAMERWQERTGHKLADSLISAVGRAKKVQKSDPLPGALWWRKKERQFTYYHGVDDGVCFVCDTREGTLKVVTVLRTDDLPCVPRT